LFFLLLSQLEKKKKRNLSEKLMGHSVSIETRIKISNGNRGNLPHTAGKHLPELVRLKISNTLKGHPGAIYKHSEEAKKKMSKSQKGKIISEKTKEKLREINTGKHPSEESKIKRSKTMKEGYASGR